MAACTRGWGSIKEFFWGLFVLDWYRGVLAEKRRHEDLLHVVLFGEFLGLPMMGGAVSLRLLPHFLPHLPGWRSRRLTEAEVLTHAPSCH